jgi:hypothetical protein
MMAGMAETIVSCLVINKFLVNSCVRQYFHYILFECYKDSYIKCAKWAGGWGLWGYNKYVFKGLDLGGKK